MTDDGGFLSRFHDELKFIEAKMAEQIERLAPDKRTKVSEVCAMSGLNETATRDVLCVTCDLIDFELYVRPSVLTPAERFNALEQVRDAARGIAEIVGDLSANDRVALMVGVSRDRAALGLDGTGVMSPLVFEAWANAANSLLQQSYEDQGKGGRRPLRAEYMRFIAPLANTFDKAGLPVGRGGIFERICTVVFEVAGVRATPEGTIRYYLAERKKRPLDAMENSSDNAPE